MYKMLKYHVSEERTIVKFVKSLNLRSNYKILDVGCGYGRILKLLKENNIYATGIDINKNIVEHNINSGLNCMNLNDFNNSDDLYDLIIMSHIIEHFQPSDLLEFMESYLDRLKLGGSLIIATPLESPIFYCDFDHVKPYYPWGIERVFGDRTTQLQYHSRNKLELINIWFRKGPFKLLKNKTLYMDKERSLVAFINRILNSFFVLSFGIIGLKNGWVGLYKKCE